MSRRLLVAALFAASAAPFVPAAHADCVPQRVELPPVGLGACYALDDNCVLIRLYSRQPLSGAGYTDVKHCL